MAMTSSRELQIEDLRNHPAEMVITLRSLLTGGAKVNPDPKRPDFFEVESGSLVYYIHVSPVTGKILLLATWPSEAAKEDATQAA
jgi:hypothetical protein